MKTVYIHNASELLNIVTNDNILDYCLNGKAANGMFKVYILVRV